jgi:hypothetical protein
MVEMCYSDKENAMYYLHRKHGFSDPVITIPTIGFCVHSTSSENFHGARISVDGFDIGGSDKIRPLWQTYTSKSNALVMFMSPCYEYRTLRQIDDNGTYDISYLWGTSFQFTDWIWLMLDQHIGNPYLESQRWGIALNEHRAPLYTFLLGCHPRSSSKLKMLCRDIQRVILSFVGVLPSPTGVPVVILARGLPSDISFDLIKSRINVSALHRLRGSPLEIFSWFDGGVVPDNCGKETSVTNALRWIINQHTERTRRYKSL